MAQHSEDKDMPIVLVVTNDSMKIIFFKKALKDAYSLLFAGNAESAIDTLKTIKVGCVLIDGKTSAIQPFVLCQQIRSLSSYQMIPVMLITPSIKKIYTQTALESGITDFIHTPLEKEELHERLAVAFARTKSQVKTAGLMSYISKTAKPIRKSKISLALRMRQLTKGDFFSELTKVHDIPPPICLLMIEIDDHAKLVKEKGAKLVEELVKEIGAFLRQHMRAKDLFFPQGDHNFLAILPTTSAAAGRTLAEMLREEVAKHSFIFDSKKYAPTISIGLEHYEKELGKAHAPASAFENLVDGAMRALQTARKQGNRTISSTEEFKHYEISI